ncbi:AMP-binding protein [Streptomyces anthocyanicus]|uniref:AMP-binding protein n=1 Tax=Streptomyces anthocyanicus TaxID=68174 RepID=UPI001782FD96|nr:AMP-binding protein [Streptomyces anthocyanicus]WTC50259.1 AMP-binding protein [Streptomyces anthocyanicus]GHA30769.1 fatty acid CoA ligase [Streptomyces anthocyanicus]
MSRQHGTTQTRFSTYTEALLDVLSAAPSRPVLTTADGSVISAGALREQVCRLGGELERRGVGRGDTVGLLTGNSADGLAARYAANLTGARVVVLYEGMSAPVMARILASVDGALLLVDDLRHDVARELLPLPGVPPVLSLGPSDFAEDVLAAAARHPTRAMRPTRAPVGPDDDWRIGYTGGTTGIPKGIRMSHGSYRRSLERRLTGAGDPPRFLACTSLAHLAGIFADTALLEGGSVVLRHDFEPGDVLATVERERITHTWLLPPLLYRLLDHPDLSATDLSSLSRVTYGGTAAAPTRLRQAAGLLGPVLYGLYGQAEAQLISETGPAEQELTGREGHPTVGRAVPGVEILVQDTDGTPMKPGTPGEVLVRSPYAMHGYWKQPELTREVLRDGWVHTGDVGYLDENGYLYIVDRIKEMIVVVGGHVYPAELEALLLNHPSVAQCTVFGSRDEESVEHVHAAVVPVRGHTPSLEEIRAFVTARKGHLYAPETVHLVPAIPLTAVGKPDKRRLRSLLPG